MIPTKILEPRWKKSCLWKQCFSKDPTFCVRYTWNRGHDTCICLLTGCREDVKMGTLPLPPPRRKKISRSRKVCPLSILGTWWRYSSRGAVSISRGEDGERKGCHLGQSAYGSCLTERMLLSGPVTACHFLPRHPHCLPKTSRCF